MGTKDFFDKGYSLKFLKDKAQADFREDVESFRYVDAYSKRRDRFIPDTDFATASNFAAYGLAELYYKQSIERVYKTYPYDGSLAEKVEWENDSTYLDLYMFENEYPRSNGFVNVSNKITTTEQSNVYSSSAPQYIFFTGNPHPDVSGNYKQPATAGPAGVGVSKANIYETGSYRTNNLEIDPVKGFTIEFWMKKDGWAATNSNKFEYVFNNFASGASDDDFGSLRVYTYGASPGTIGLTIQSGSSTDNVLLATELSSGVAGGLADGKWHHYAISFKRSGTVNVAKLYVDGVHKETENGDDHVNSISGKMVATVGALAGPLKNGDAGRGWGGLVSSSIDEFRYWKTERDAKQIGRHFRDQIGGGTNTDNVKYNKTHNPVDLGVYFKFNEGITGDNTVDSIVLDYSGRVSNGTFVNYQSSSSRNTGSAMVQAGVAEKEFKDPILYSTHPDIIALFEKKRIEGTVHDHENATSIFKSLPGWIAEEDEKKSDNLKYLTQIMASVFDEMQLQIKALPKLKDVNYPYDADFEKPLPFADRLLSTRGIDAPELFADASVLAKFLERDEKRLFEKKLYEVKNTIYQNIYNNLTYIQKSKGTTKSIRNLLRCFGVDEELVKVNIYAKNDTYEFKDNVSHTAFRKKYADFDDAESRYGKNGIYAGSYGATVYQYYDPANANSKSYVVGLNDVAHGLSATLEAEAIFPKRSPEKDDLFGIFPGNEVSLFGLHAVEESDTVLTWLNDTINFNVIAVKDPVDNRRVKFKLASNASSVIPELVTTGSYDVYDNEKWNFAFRLRPTKKINNQLMKSHSSLANDVDGSLLPADSAYTVELYGVNYVSDHLQNEFTLSATISETNARAFFTKAKRVYAGAHRTNYNGALIRASDAKISSVAMWYDYLNDEDIKAHGRDATNFGRLHPYKNAAFNEANVAGMTSLFNARVPEIDTLVFHWNFENVTGSDASGQFLALDISSGSAEDRTNQRYGVLSNVNTYHYSARGDLFEASSDQAVDIEFVPTAKQRIPEVVNSDDMIKILNQQDDVMFTRDTTYVQHIISVEKSMYQSISNEMMRMFATVADFNNIIGDPVNRYRQNYKHLAKLRSTFFEIVENVPDLEKYIEYFKWIDDAISLFIFQLLPASSNKVEFLRNMVESHILERSKHFNKFPTIEMNNPEPQEAFKGINELMYNWKIGSPPVIGKDGAIQAPHATENQNRNSLWWKERASRSTELTSGNGLLDTDKNTILKTIITETSGNDNVTLSYPNSAIDKKDGEYGKQTATKVKYSASYYRDRSTSTPVRVSQEFVKTYKGGPNPDGQKLHDFYKGVIKFGSDNDYIWLDKNHVIPPVDSLDVIKAESSSSVEGFYLPHKKEFPAKVFTMTATEIIDSNASGSGDDDYKYSDSTNKMIMPFSMYANRTGKIQSYGNMNNEVANDYTMEYDQYFDSDHNLYAHSTLHGRTSRVEFNNMHHDVYGPTYEAPMQGPFSRQHVGGNQHRHIELNAQKYHALDLTQLKTVLTDLYGYNDEKTAASLLTEEWLTQPNKRKDRPEGWELSYGGTTATGFTGSATTDYFPLDIPFAPYNMPPEMSGSDPSPGATKQTGSQDDPSEHDRWVNVTTNPKFMAGSKTGWRFADNIPDPLGGPNADATFAQEGVSGNGYFAYAKKGPLDADNLGPLFGFRSPLVDLLDGIPGSTSLSFYYHMYGENENGKFYVQHSQDPNFGAGVTDLTVTWEADLLTKFEADSIQGNQQLSKDEAWKKAEISLSAYAGTRFYIRFVWDPPAFHEAVCAIDGVKVDAGRAETSFKLLHPTHDDATRPHAMWMREEFARRPVNIKNTKMGFKTNLSAIEEVEVLAASHLPEFDGGDLGHPLVQAWSFSKRSGNKVILHPGESSPKTAVQAGHADYAALQRTIAGNYRNTYEYFNTVSRESNDKAFKQNVAAETFGYQQHPGLELGLDGVHRVYPTEGLQHNFSTRLPARNFDDDPKWHAKTNNHLTYDRTQYGTEDRLAWYNTVDTVAGGVKTSAEGIVQPPDVYSLGGRPEQHKEFERLNPQKTRIVNFFSAPGDFMDSCAGFKDEAHRTYSVYNALPWRNYHVREQLKTSLTAHCGRFGKGTHTQDGTVAKATISIPSDAANTALNTLASFGTGFQVLPAIQLVDHQGVALRVYFVAKNNPQGINFVNGQVVVAANALGLKTLLVAIVMVKDTAEATMHALGKVIGVANNVGNELTATQDERLQIGVQTSLHTVPFFEDATNKKLLLHPWVPETPAVAQKAGLIYGSVGNTVIHTGKAGLISFDTDGDGTIEVGEFDEPIDSSIIEVVSFYGGEDPTARVLKSQAISPVQQTGSISKADYTVVSASFHKYHRNRGDKLVLGKNTQESWEYVVSGSTQLPHDQIARDSVYDNAYVSHAIPRKNDYPRWIRSVTGLIQEELWLESEPNDQKLQQIAGLDFLP